MARKPQKPCRYPGCYRLTTDGYCQEHRPQYARSDESAKWHKWYLLPIWTKDLRPTQLMREPYCRECAKHGLRVFATDVDHIEDHKGNWEKFIDRDNLESLCHACHSRKTLLEMRRKVRHKKC